MPPATLAGAPDIIEVGCVTQVVLCLCAEEANFACSPPIDAAKATNEHDPYAMGLQGASGWLPIPLLHQTLQFMPGTVDVWFGCQTFQPGGSKASAMHVTPCCCNFSLLQHWHMQIAGFERTAWQADNQEKMHAASIRGHRRRTSHVACC
jgi:hypothetical protein